jgi:putative DNA primase/helicase
MGIEEKMLEGVEPEKSLAFAMDFCRKHKTIALAESQKIYVYEESSGYYKQIASARKTTSIENMIASLPGGIKLTPRKRQDVIDNILMLSVIAIEKTDPAGFLCLKNGILNLKTKELSAFSSEMFFLSRLEYPYTPEAPATLWEKYLHESLRGDINKIKLLQEFAGYCFFKSCKFEKALLLHGPGSTGKSVFVDTLRNIIGSKNCSAVPLEGLSDASARCDIRGKKINIDSDLTEHARYYEGIFKKIVSGEAIFFNEKYLPTTSQDVSCKLIFCVNNFPYIHDSTNAFYRRLLSVQFDNIFSGPDADVDLKHKFATPEQLTGIFNWILIGYDRLIAENKFSENIYSKKFNEELRKENNPLLDFLEDCLELNQNVCITKKDVWELYKNWIVANGHKNFLPFKKFNRKLLEEYRGKKVESVLQPFGDRVHGWHGLDSVSIPVSQKWILKCEE